MLKTISENYFWDEVPRKPKGKYTHIIVLRETESYAVFHTDGELNTAQARAGVEDNSSLTRIVMFKRKQSTPERLTGREIMRRYLEDTVSDCDYNVNFCMKCPDCIYYGCAIGESGSEKSKLMVDSAFSITGYDESHEQFTLNAPYESGTPFRKGEARSAFAEQDHVIPQVFFPCVETIKDPTQTEFIYILNNILRTKHYGAQTTRTGKVRNQMVGIVFADGEIFSNLKLTQKCWDWLKDNDKLTSPLEREAVIESIDSVLPKLLSEDRVCFGLVKDNDLSELLNEIESITTDEEKLAELLDQAYKETSEYAKEYLQK